jgi:hypothetical protein
MKIENQDEQDIDPFYPKMLSIPFPEYRSNSRRISEHQTKEDIDSNDNQWSQYYEPHRYLLSKMIDHN